jgi:hypothetical protein
VVKPGSESRSRKYETAASTATPLKLGVESPFDAPTDRPANARPGEIGVAICRRKEVGNQRLLDGGVR